MIKNIIPAAGWAAIYEIENSTVAKPLACWGTVKNEFDDYITGFIVNDIGDVVNAKTQIGFKTFEFDIDSANVDYMALKNE